ncbi:hypothetical protein [Alteromonas sp. ASW11-130]|uniref:hypothetical protein n=1 Tax=Alteromonas sp. ASW11-130 TaxID=3015775 RepID=UPI0022419D4E|nr:hypothetical protein [Alteromonas sp. ASW11-130]MCW8092275.1 hypothetical protein [Alteromonas sp. ASW11-130]
MLNQPVLQHRKTSLSIAIIIPFVALLIPFIASQSSAEFNWSVTDFVLVGTMLLVASLTFWFLSHKVTSRYCKTGIAIGILAYLAAMWANLAVGIVGNPENPVNLVFYALLLISTFITYLGKFSSKKLILAMLVPLIGFLVMASVAFFYNEPVHVQFICLSFSCIFAMSAWLINTGSRFRL